MSNIIQEDIRGDGKWVMSVMLDGKQVFTKLGSAYNAMSQRGKPGGSYQRKFPRYEGATVHEAWKDKPQAFADWIVLQPGWQHGWHLDKDLLLPGNKVYGPDTCCLLPRTLNNAIRDNRESSRARVCKDGRWELRYDILGPHVVKGFTDQESALLCYRELRRMRVLTLADELKTQLDPRAYPALLNWQP